jgi:hypothetical protein
MPGQDAPPGREERYRQAITAFAGAGLRPPPSRALAVTALAGARRSVASHQARGESLGKWLAGEVRVRGIRENAAVLAVLELPEYRAMAAQGDALLLAAMARRPYVGVAWRVRRNTFACWQ